MFMCCCCCSTQRARARAHSPDPQAQEPLSPWTEVLLARFNTTSVPHVRHVASLTVKLITNRPRTARHGPPSTNHMVLD